MSRPNEVFVEPDDELLVAAQRGDWERLERLLSKEDDTATRDVVVRIEEPVAVTTVVASRGDGEEFLKSATVIYDKASRLLQARNSDGDTPLHCADRAGWGKMLTHLVALATRGDGGHEKVKAMLRMQNEKGETATRGDPLGEQGHGRVAHVGGPATSSDSTGPWRLALVLGRLAGTR
uniref:Uncharacterized protein n=1 Tax=Avena sativa TaxID=4498 RepID=A0ACD5Y8X8_AVESA